MCQSEILIDSDQQFLLAGVNVILFGGVEVWNPKRAGWPEK